MTNSKLGKAEAIAFIVIIMLNNIVSILPKTLINQCGSSTPLNIIYITILVFIFLWIMFKLWKNFGNNDILDISEFLGGKPFKIIIGVLFILYFITISATLLRNFAEMLQLVYYENMAIGFIILFFLITCIIANKFGFRSIAKCNFIIIPLMLLNILIACLSIFSKFEIKRFFPILGYGINETFFCGISNLFAFSGLGYLYFLGPLLKEPKDFNKIGYMSICISALYLFLSIIALLFSFASTLIINELSPIYLLIRNTDYGTFLQRPDALFILGWILSLISYLSITLCFICNIFKKMTNTQGKIPIIYVFSAIIFIVAMLPKNQSSIYFIQNTIIRYFTIILVFIISFIILLFANIKSRYLNKEQKRHD